jgi:hypothetical protein
VLPENGDAYEEPGASRRTGSDASRRDSRLRAGRSAGLWPDGKRFAFTIFDDTDSQTVANTAPVYEFLTEIGMCVTKSVWVLEPEEEAEPEGHSCADPAYLDWVYSLQEDGHEIALHNVASSTSSRERTLLGLDRFRELFGSDPRSLANHAENSEGIYHGDARVTGWRRSFYNLLTRGRRRRHFEGHVPGSPVFWGDLCQERLTYVRNFVYRDINLLNACPYLPYHDPAKPFVQQWFAGSEGGTTESFTHTLSERNQQRLEDERGLCIMYTHFGYDFCRSGKLDADFERLMRRLAQRNGWFAPVSTILDHMRETQGDWQLRDDERRLLERRWLADKLRAGKATS